jgi:hypothetical protein
MLWISPLVATVVGVLVYAFATNPKLVEFGRALMWVGLFWLVHEAGASGSLLGRH